MAEEAIIIGLVDFKKNKKASFSMGGLYVIDDQDIMLCQVPP